MAAAAGWLWWQARSHDRILLNYRAAAAEIENIGRVAADWRQEASRVWADALADASALDSFATEIAQHRAILAHALLGLPRMSARLANDLSAYGNAIDAHIERVARFQSYLAAIRVAARRLPEDTELLAAATSADLDPFAAALGATLESAAGATARVAARDQRTALALAGGMSLPWLAFAVARGKGTLASFARQRPRTSPRASRVLVRRRGTTRSRPVAANGQAAPATPRDGAEALPPTGDTRAAYALLRARALADFLAVELADIAKGIDDAAPSSARLAELGHGLAATATAHLGSNTRYEVLDVNECVNEAIAAGSRSGFVTVTRQLGVVPPVFASKAEIVVLLANVVENAVQAARRNHGDEGAITVATAEKRGKATITVADNGAGLPDEPAERELLFKPFRTLRDGHLGIGLATARKLAENNGGAVALASADRDGGATEASTRGTVARITLPHA